MGHNYFNTLPLRLQLKQLGKCRFMGQEEFTDGVDRIRGKKIVIVGCGAQGLNQGLNLREHCATAQSRKSVSRGKTPQRTDLRSGPMRN